MEDILKLLKETKIGSILSDNKIIELNGTNTIEEAILKLSQNKILSAPIYKDGNYIGLVDYTDISKKKKKKRKRKKKIIFQTNQSINRILYLPNHLS